MQEKQSQLQRLMTRRRLPRRRIVNAWNPRTMDGEAVILQQQQQTKKQN